MRIGSRCAHPIVLPEVSSDYRWPAGTIVTWTLDPESPLPNGLNQAQVLTALGWAFDRWSHHSAIVESRVDGSTDVRVLVQFAAIDPSGVELGLTQLPIPGVRQVVMQLNTAVPWTVFELGQVAMHEFGHALGVGHCTDGEIAVMDPIYNAALSDLQPWDIAQAVERYPLPAAAVVPVPATPPPPATLEFEVTEAGSADVLIDFPAAGKYTITVAPTT